MNDLRGFYGRLADGPAPDERLRIAAPESTPPTLITVSLPHFKTPESH
jgi:hypothetical protein